MKRLWCALILTSIAICICFFEFYSVRNCYKTFVDTIDKTRASVEEGDYQTANILSKKIKKDWDNNEKKLNYILEHTAMDELSKDISELPDYTDKESKDDFLSVNDRIKKQLTSLYTSELPIGENIF